MDPLKIMLVAACLALSPSWVSAEEWALYAGSWMDRPAKAALGDWYALNKLPPVPGPEATADHYIDEESIGGSLVAETAIVRVWEKYVLRAETEPFEEVRAKVIAEEQIRLGRKLGIIDMPGLFPLVVNRAVKQVRTLFEINCYSNEFTILEVNIYDSEGSRMVREAGFNTDIWMPIIPGTVMETFAKKACGRD